MPDLQERFIAKGEIVMGWHTATLRGGQAACVSISDDVLGGSKPFSISGGRWCIVPQHP